MLDSDVMPLAFVESTLAMTGILIERSGISLKYPPCVSCQRVETSKSPLLPSKITRRRASYLSWKLGLIRSFTFQIAMHGLTSESFSQNATTKFMHTVFC